MQRRIDARHGSWGTTVSVQLVGDREIVERALEYERRRLTQQTRGALRSHEEHSLHLTPRHLIADADACVQNQARTAGERAEVEDLAAEDERVWNGHFFVLECPQMRNVQPFSHHQRYQVIHLHQVT